MTQRTAAKIRAYCEAATWGPWRYYHDALECIISVVVDGNGFPVLEIYQISADGIFAANAHEDLPRVLEAATELFSMVAHLYHEFPPADMADSTREECERMLDVYDWLKEDE